MSQPGIDFPGLMRAGIGGLRLKPDDFWRLTPAELLIMLGLETGQNARMGRARLQELAALYPDTAPAKTDA